MDFRKELYDIASRLTDSKALEEWAVTYGIRDDAYIRQLILDLKWKELQLELEIPDITPGVPRPTSPQPGPSGLQSRNEDDVNLSQVFTPEQINRTLQCIEDFEAQSDDDDQEVPAKRGRLDDVPSPTRDMPYRMSKRRVRTFKNNGATDTTYEVKFTEGWQGRKLTELISELYNMFDDAIGLAATG